MLGIISNETKNNTGIFVKNFGEIFLIHSFYKYGNLIRINSW